MRKARAHSNSRARKQRKTITHANNYTTMIDDTVNNIHVHNPVLMCSSTRWSRLQNKYVNTISLRMNKRRKWKCRDQHER